MRIGKSVAIAAFGLLLAGQALADAMEATNSLGRDPEPPFCVTNPGGQVDITWDIEHTTTPNFVYYKLEDPTRTTILEQQTYPFSTGITINRSWTVTSGLPDGKYWVRVEYWSFEAGNEANAEVTFYVCAETATICAFKYEDADCDKATGERVAAVDPEDIPVEDFFLCIVTPFGDQLCQLTDVNGQVCWPNIPLGTYTVKEIVFPGDGWIPVTPTEYETTVGAGDNPVFTFVNQREAACYGACCIDEGVGAGSCDLLKPDECAGQGGYFFGLGTNCDDINCATPIETKSWGQIKATYR
jgi:hypothetical protein